MKAILFVAVAVLLLNGSPVLFSQDSSLAATQEVQQKSPKKTPPADFVAYEKAPEVLKKVEPEYPAIALKSGMEGNVLVKVWVDESGNVVETDVLRSDEKIFEEAAKIAANKWKFSPAMSNGQPVAVWVSIPFRFRIPSPGKGKPDEFATFLESLNSMVMNIIQGRNIDKAKLSVSPEAYVIDGNHYENLYAVLNGEVKTCRVVDGPDSKIPFFNAVVTDDMTAASMVFKSVLTGGKRERYHTVLILRQPGGDWKIRSWHVSG
jgi:TonB family protein